MRLTLLILFSWISIISGFLCDSLDIFYCNQLDIAKVDNCNTSKFNGYPHTCTLDTTSKSNEFTKDLFGHVSLWLQTMNSTLKLQSTISYLKKYKETYIKVSEYIDDKTENCEQLTINKMNTFTMNTLLFNCWWNSTKRSKVTNYQMEVAVWNDVLYSPKRILFSTPNPLFYGEHVPLNKRLIFSYIDWTDINKIILKVQPLPIYYNVTQYKIEVFKEQDKKVQIVDVRIIPYDSKSKYINFEYRTFNEEGYHYFTISVINSFCPEDMCEKTVTAKLYISRRGNRLIIGIVGASFIIPLVLYLFYVWSCKDKYIDEISEAGEKVVILYDPSFSQHNEVVTFLAETIKHLNGINVRIDPLIIGKDVKGNLFKQCTDNLIISSYIIYITPPIMGEIEDYTVDGMTYMFLKKEIQRPNSEKKIVVVNFPYTKCQAPPFLSCCCSFELMKDFERFMHIFDEFSESINLESDPYCKDLSEKIKKAHVETENLVKNLPNIVIERDEPKEIDVLL